MTRITLSYENFSECFWEIIEKYDFNTGKLVIEITEDALAESKTLVIKNIGICKNSGCRIALNDFGCGYSSVKDLNDYPIDIIKIDKELIAWSMHMNLYYHYDCQSKDLIFHVCNFLLFQNRQTY